MTNQLSSSTSVKAPDYLTRQDLKKEFQVFEQRLMVKIEHKMVQLMTDFSQQILVAVGQKFDEVDARFDRIEARLDKIEARLDSLEVNQLEHNAQFTQLFGTLTEHDRRISRIEYKVGALTN